MRKNRLFPITEKTIYATGKRKTSTAKVWINKGKGKATVNGMDLSTYFTKQQPHNFKSEECLFRVRALEALSICDMQNKFDIMCSVQGGGCTGQVEAIRHGIAKCIRLFDEDKKIDLRTKGLLTRDSRKVERKKYGLRKARKATQFSKR